MLRRRLIPGLGTFAAVLILAAWAVSFRWTNGPINLEALFSGLAFVVLTMALFLQREDLRLQREELGLPRAAWRLTRQDMLAPREELRKSAEAQSESVRAMERAAFLSAAAEMVKYYQGEESFHRKLVEGYSQNYNEGNRDRLRHHRLGMESAHANAQARLTALEAVLQFTESRLKLDEGKT